MNEIDKISITAPFKLRELDTLLPRESVIKELTIWQKGYGGRKFLFTAEAARRLAESAGIKSLSLNCAVSRAALQYIARIPELKFLDIDGIQGPGRVRGMEAAQALDMLIFRYASDSTVTDVRGLARARNLRWLNLQCTNISARLIADLAGMPKLGELDLEATAFDNAMAEVISSSSSLHTLHLGATRITKGGLRHLARMTQIKEIDLWWCAISVEDLRELEVLPNLEKLTFGTGNQGRPFDSEALIAALARLPALKRIWLDGVDMTPAQIAQLKERYEEARIDPPG